MNNTAHTDAAKAGEDTLDQVQRPVVDQPLGQGKKPQYWADAAVEQHAPMSAAMQSHVDAPWAEEAKDAPWAQEVVEAQEEQQTTLNMPADEDEDDENIDLGLVLGNQAPLSNSSREEDEETENTTSEAETDSDTDLNNLGIDDDDENNDFGDEESVGANAADGGAEEVDNPMEVEVDGDNDNDLSADADSNDPELANDVISENENENEAENDRTSGYDGDLEPNNDQEADLQEMSDNELSAAEEGLAGVPDDGDDDEKSMPGSQIFYGDDDEEVEQDWEANARYRRETAEAEDTDMSDDDDPLLKENDKSEEEEEEQDAADLEEATDPAFLDTPDDEEIAEEAEVDAMVIEEEPVAPVLFTERLASCGYQQLLEIKAARELADATAKSFAEQFSARPLTSELGHAAALLQQQANRGAVAVAAK